MSVPEGTGGGRRVFRIGSREYRSKEAAKVAIRQVLYRYQLGASVAQADHEFVADLLRLHPDADRKGGVGIARFEVCRNGGTRGFWVIRTDGSETDFSYLECLRASSHQEKVRGAMRSAIVEQRDQFRDQAFAAGVVTCAITGVLLTEANCHVDHFNPTFEQLADEFVVGEGGYEAVDVVSEDGMIGSRLVDPQLQRRWQEFHGSRAQLRLVSAQANLSLLRRRNGNRAA